MLTFVAGHTERLRGEKSRADDGAGLQCIEPALAWSGRRCSEGQRAASTSGLTSPTINGGTRRHRSVTKNAVSEEGGIRGRRNLRIINHHQRAHRSAVLLTFIADFHSFPTGIAA